MTKIVSLNVSMPDTLRTFVEQQAKTGGYTSTSEYVRELIRRDQRNTPRHARKPATDVDPQEKARREEESYQEFYKNVFQAPYPGEEFLEPEDDYENGPDED